jgi:outer membrane protein assembly factor BamB
MTVIPFPTRAASFEPAPREDSRPHARALAALLQPDPPELELPPLAELLGALLDLASGARRKALVPVVGQPLELALLRRGASVLVSLYHTDASPSVVCLDRRVPLRALLDATAAALAEEASDRRFFERLLARAASTPLADVIDDGRSATVVRGGAVEDPGSERPLSFGFEAAIFAGDDDARGALRHADLHAMLFGGQLWAWVRGRRIPIFKGPVVLAAQRMLAACGGFVDAWREGRAPHVRQRVGSFSVALRSEGKPDRVQLTVGTSEDGIVTIPSLDVPTLVRAILRLGSELLRALCAVDRSQVRNLRVQVLRAEVRRISRAVRELKRAASLANADPDRLRTLPTAAGDISAPDAGEVSSPKSVGWGTRWTASLSSLDAENSHLLEDLLVATIDDAVVVLDRERGDALWQRKVRSALTLASPHGVLTVSERGLAVLHELRSGDPLFEVRLDAKDRKATGGLLALGRDLPPTAIVLDGRDGLTAFDLRTGAPRFRFVQPGPGTLKVEREGRVLVVVAADGTVSALDAASGALAWRYADDVHAVLPPVIAAEQVFIVSGEPQRGTHELVALDLFAGTARFRVELDGPAVAVKASGGRIVVALDGGDDRQLAAFDAGTGTELWTRPDPGVGQGAGTAVVGERLFVNTAAGRLTAIDLRTGRTDWQRVLSGAETDDVPRRLDPIASAGVLFVPSGTIHALRPEDGASIGGRSRDGVPQDLVADFLRIDAEGWLFVGEESGRLVALAPQRRLSLVRPA